MSTIFSADDHRHMARALQLAEAGLYTTQPNPRVGCVLVRDGRVVGEGAHVRAGEGHAEVLALRQAGEAARGATAYVTMEPCSHFGRTPPCADALIEAGVGEVITAMEDPNPQVAGRGAARLQAAGIVVRTGLLEAEARALNPGFTSRMSRGRPYVRVKLAMSLDGRTAMASGESKWISSEAARRDVHRLRARSCAIVTGIGTVSADDPALTVRDVELPARWHGQPRRVVLDWGLATPPAARVVQGEGGCLLFHGEAAPARVAALQAAGALVEQAPGQNRRLDLNTVLNRLAQLEINEVLVEAGPVLAGAFVQAGLADELVIYMAPHLMGDAARPLLQLPGVAAMADRLPLEIIELRQLGPDLRIRARLS
jgi:diaminohydroxyphosphoribosylaminopyrimidine deaminase/5-amino-6-(5-phosphoribosylamino)uracil reductase